MHGRFVLALAVLLCAVVPAGSAAATWKSYQVTTAGFSIALPPTWVDLTSATPAVLKLLEKSPALRATAKLASQSDAIRLIVADPVANGHAYMDAGVQRVGAVKSEELLAATVKQLRKAVGKKGKIATASISLPAGKASIVRFEYGTKNGAIETMEYLLLRDQVEYVFAYTAPKANWKKYLPVFAASATTFRFLKGPDLSHVILSAAQVGPGYKLASFPQGNSVIGETTLDLCAGSYPSEMLRVGRLQVQYTHKAHAVDVSNEVVTYVTGGAKLALSEVAKVAKSCAKKPVVRKEGGTTTTFSATPIHDPKLPAGAIALRVEVTLSKGKSHLVRRGLVVYQIKGDTLSGIYAFVAKGTTIAETIQVGFHAAEQSAKNLGSLALIA